MSKENFDKTACERAAAHLCDLAGIAFRNGDIVSGRALSRYAIDVINEPEGRAFYMQALRIAGLAPEDIDAAVAAVLEGKHPADSLMGRVAQMRIIARRDDTKAGDYACDAFDAVLDLLEGEGRNASTARLT